MGNAATVHGIYEAFGQGDIGAILGRLADDVAWEAWPQETTAQRAGIPWLAERRGPEQVAGFFESLGALEFHEFAPRALIADGNQVVAQITVDLEVRDTGRRFRDEELHFWVFDDEGRVSAFRHHVDTGKHVEAVLGSASTLA